MKDARPADVTAAIRLVAFHTTGDDVAGGRHVIRVTTSTSDSYTSNYIELFVTVEPVNDPPTIRAPSFPSSPALSSSAQQATRFPEVVFLEGSMHSRLSHPARYCHYISLARDERWGCLTLFPRASSNIRFAQTLETNI